MRMSRCTFAQVLNRTSPWNLLLSIGAFLLFMVVLLAALGGGVGTVELLIWLGVVGLGVILIVRRYRNARAGAERPAGG